MREPPGSPRTRLSTKDGKEDGTERSREDAVRLSIAHRNRPSHGFKAGFRASEPSLRTPSTPSRPAGQWRSSRLRSATVAGAAPAFHRLPNYPPRQGRDGTLNVASISLDGQKDRRNYDIRGVLNDSFSRPLGPPHAACRNWLGVCPTMLLNSRAKCDALVKPTSRAISMSGDLDCNNSAFACSTLTCL